MVERLKKRLKDNPKVNLVDMSIPLTNGEETPLLKSVLEKSVDEKYYVRHDIVEKIVQETDFKERLVSIKLDKKK